MRWEEGLSTWKCGAETSDPPSIPPSISPSPLYSATYKTSAPCRRDEPHARGMRRGDAICAAQSLMLWESKQILELGKLRGHLSDPMISPMAGLSVMVRLVLLPGAKACRWDERFE